MAYCADEKQRKVYTAEQPSKLIGEAPVTTLRFPEITVFTSAFIHRINHI